LANINISYCPTIILKSGGKMECSEIMQQDKNTICLIHNNKVYVNTNNIEEILYSTPPKSNKKNVKQDNQLKKAMTDVDPEIKKLELQYWQSKNESSLNQLINAYIAKANENYINNNFENALSYLLKLESLAPFDSLTKLKIAYCYFRLSDFFMSQYYAQESKKLNKTIPETYFLLGDIYYYQNNLFDAKNEWEQGLSLKNDPAYQEKLANLLKEIELSKQQSKSTSNHFKVEFDTNSVDRSSINNILNILEEYYKELTIAFNYYPKEPISIIIYSDKDFKEFTKSPDWSSGLYDGKIKLPGKNININDKFSEIIKHELVHALITKKTNANAPAWLQEGLALYFQNAKINNDIKLLTMPNLTSFPQTFADLSEETSAAYYAKSFSFINYLINQYGTWKIILLLDELSTGKKIEDAFKSAYLQDLNDIEQQWRNYILSFK
jgi:hypothetical protein